MVKLTPEKPLFELLELKFNELERNPYGVWMHYGGSMPYCRLSGKCFQGGNAVLMDAVMTQRGYRIPVFGYYWDLKPFKLDLKPNQHLLPIPLTVCVGINNWTGEKMLEVQYANLPTSEKENCTLLLQSATRYVFNVEQTYAERNNIGLWDEWQERYAGAPPDFGVTSAGAAELDCLIEVLRPRYPSYFVEKPANFDPMYYCKCAQTLAYLAYKSLPVAQNDLLNRDPKLALLASEIAGAFLCAKYGLRSFANKNFLENIPAIRGILQNQTDIIPVLGQVNRIGIALDVAMDRQRGLDANRGNGGILDYIAKSAQVNQKIRSKYNSLGFSINGTKNEVENRRQDEKPGEDITPGRGR